ncbi:MAG: 2-amino-4-hydroxy-6-hydroxymethyldihydropteridine diphosphokinase [candidate division Zixibacteria bacterium]|nr:2-amino-4-hydroxy-6-hydroxymethyldihydropteridine diphosphokinase [candidate division Zixibacteria bacterium]
MADVFIGFGSNLGDRHKNIKDAISRLKKNLQIEIEKLSSLYESAPVEMQSPNLFLNGVAQMHTCLTPLKLLSALQAVEEKLGRDLKTKGKKQDRTIDLDILFYNDLIFAVPELAVPHPQAHKRRFILLPMAEIAPDFEHPILHLRMQEMLKNLDSHEETKACPDLTISP